MKIAYKNSQSQYNWTLAPSIFLVWVYLLYRSQLHVLFLYAFNINPMAYRFIIVLNLLTIAVCDNHTLFIYQYKSVGNIEYQKRVNLYK